MAASSAPSEDSVKCTVAFQGEKGAYSEAAIFQLLGREGVLPVACPSFDEAFATVSRRGSDLLMVPIENSLGGTIHANCDLQLQHSLFIIAEIDFRVRHCLMALPGTKKGQLTKIISHPQALAQCDSYIARSGIKKEASYDTAGSAKMISEGKLEGVAAICSELAADYFGLEILDRGIEDDSKNFTRFLLLARCPVRVPVGVKSKTSVVFSLVNQAGALFKALSVFALRDIDLTKIESRPCKPDIMDRLERLFWGMGGGIQAGGSRSFPWEAEEAQKAKRQRVDGGEGGGAQHALAKTEAESAQPQYRYLFYVDFQANTEDPNVCNALKHLQEITTFFRVLGSYPRSGTLVGLENFGLDVVKPVFVAAPRKRLGLIGFGNFGQFMCKNFTKDYDCFVTSRGDYSQVAKDMGCHWCSTLEELLGKHVDILVIATSIFSFEGQVRLVAQMLHKLGLVQSTYRPLVVDVCSVKVHAKTTMLALLPDSCDILCTHPMFGPESGKHGWGGLNFVYERVRVKASEKCEDHLRWWGEQGCRMLDMTCELHDELAAGSQFVTHFTGRMLDRLGLRSTPINTKGFETLLNLVENTCKDSSDLFSALYKFNPNSNQQLQAIREALTAVSKDLEDKA